MPVYRFNLGNTDPVLDHEGTDLPDDDAARTHAVAVAKELTSRNRVMFDRDWSRYTMSVVDDGGHEILSFAVDTIPHS